MEETMNTRSLVRFVFILVVAVLFTRTANPQNARGVRQEMIVSTEWLAKHLNDDSLVLLQVGEKKEYVASHIPGAQYIALEDISTRRGEGLAREVRSCLLGGSCVRGGLYLSGSCLSGGSCV